MASDLVNRFSDLLREMDVPVRIGLRQQGHIPTIEGMLADRKTWEEIGEAIHWDPATAEQWYGWETEGRPENEDASIG